jgi:anti-sigma factor RsiW
MTHNHLKHSSMCPQMIEKCLDYLDGDLAGQDLDKVIALLESCDCCKRCLEELRLTQKLLQQMPQPELSNDVKNRLKACLKKHG